MARRRLPDLADDQRCTRNGTNWRCHLPRLPGKSYCQKHQLFNLARSQSKSKTKSQSQSQSLGPVSSFNLREIWAFDSPRLYGRVERLIPAQSSVEITPLISHPTPSPDAACGLFRPADAAEVRDMAGFSHRVWFETEGDQLYKIVPRKGEIWAVQMYNWVEMVTSFSEQEGGSGAVLVEDEGGIFRRKLYDGCELMRRFLAGELWMFLHRVSGARVVEGYQGMLESRTLTIEGAEYYSPSREVTTCLQSEACGTSLEQPEACGTNLDQDMAPVVIEGENIVSKTNEGDAVTTIEDTIMANSESHQTMETYELNKGENAVTIVGDLIVENGDSHQTVDGSNEVTDVGASIMETGDSLHTTDGSKINEGENAVTLVGDDIIESGSSHQIADASKINKGENAVTVGASVIVENGDSHQTVDASQINGGEDVANVIGNFIMQNGDSHETSAATSSLETTHPVEGVISKYTESDSAARESNQQNEVCSKSLQDVRKPQIEQL